MHTEDKELLPCLIAIDDVESFVMHKQVIIMFTCEMMSGGGSCVLCRDTSSWLCWQRFYRMLWMQQNSCQQQSMSTL